MVGNLAWFIILLYILVDEVVMINQEFLYFVIFVLVSLIFLFPFANRIDRVITITKISYMIRYKKAFVMRRKFFKEAFSEYKKTYKACQECGSLLLLILYSKK